jgi:hypothetical protein
MKHFLVSWTPIFIPELAAARNDSSNKDARFYLTDIYAKDYKLASQKEFISEVSVPIVYKNMVPYGYIQVNNLKPMDSNHFTVMKRFAVMINEFFLKENLFVPSKEKFIVNDLSSKGIGIVFRDRRLMRFFLKDSHLIIELTLPDSNKVTMRVNVRNTIFNDSGIIKVGMEVVNIDAISEVNYDEYLDTLKQ